MWILSDEYDPHVNAVTTGGFYIMGTDGSALRRLVPSSGRYLWSPDGCWLANNQGSLSLFNPRQGDNILLSGNLGMTFGTPAWSANSTRIAITVDPDHLTQGDSDVAVFPIDGSSPPTVIRLPGDQIDQAWLPDGRILVLDRNGLWLVRADGTIERRIVTGPLVPGRLVASPTATQAAVTQPAQDGTSDDPVMLIDLGGEQATPRPACGEAGIFRSRAPVWSPTGDRLACPVRIDGRAAVMLAPVDGTPATLLDDDFDSPDWVGNRLVGVDHTGALVAIDADGTDRTVLSRSAGFPVSSPALSPSGRDIAFAIR
jgi:Tol biopolymer transport system component